MLPVSNSQPLPLSCQQIAIVITSIVVALVLCALGGYLTQVTTPAIAYSFIGTGGLTLMATLTYLAISLCKRSKETLPENSQRPEPPKEEPEKKPPEAPKELPKEIPQVKPPEVLPQKPAEAPPIKDTPDTPPPREKIQLINVLLYQTKCDPLIKYCRQVGGREQALKLLQNKGKEPGDYTFYQQNANKYTLLVLDYQKKVREVEICDPMKYSGDIYNEIYELLMYPILPNEPEMTVSAIHSIFTRFKNVAFYKEMDGNYTTRNTSSFGTLQNFIVWLKGNHKKIRFNPTVFFKIIGHTFGLMGKYTYKYKGANSGVETECEVDYEGFTSEMGRSILMYDILEDLPASQYAPAIKEKIAKMCWSACVANGSAKYNPTARELMALLNAGIPITVFSGWPGHAVNITMTKEFLIYANKGDQAGTKPGIHLYRIEGKITEENLQKLLGLNDKQQFPAEGRSSYLEQLFGLKYLKTFLSSYQKVGCCVFANNLLSYKSAPLNLGVKEQIVEKEYKAGKQRIRLKWLDAFFTLIDKEEDDPNLKKELYFFLLLLTLKLVTKKTYNRGKENPHDREVLGKIESKVVELQKQDNHVFLNKVREYLQGKITYTNLESAHQNIVAASITCYGNYYLLKQQRKNS